MFLFFFWGFSIVSKKCISTPTVLHKPLWTPILKNTVSHEPSALQQTWICVDGLLNSFSLLSLLHRNPDAIHIQIYKDPHRPALHPPPEKCPKPLRPLHTAPLPSTNCLVLAQVDARWGHPQCVAWSWTATRSKSSWDHWRQGHWRQGRAPMGSTHPTPTGPKVPGAPHSTIGPQLQFPCQSRFFVTEEVIDSLECRVAAPFAADSRLIYFCRLCRKSSQARGLWGRTRYLRRRKRGARDAEGCSTKHRDMIKRWSGTDTCDRRDTRDAASFPNDSVLRNFKLSPDVTTCHHMSPGLTATHWPLIGTRLAWGSCTASQQDSAHILLYKCEVFGKCLQVLPGHVAVMLQVVTMLRASTMYCKCW